ncbi:MAG: hypothetical protein KF730_10350 [Sphingomonas sp.]|uniref:hypothetical protein n=1 Tax=Sphingomonas sp. TaxID=28214 RepID=UPI0025D4DB0E|nr:hypothetical protein [Sphingomonas sp.]MBX3564963.1 hypothetical protein [Sphingomonas sp.]
MMAMRYALAALVLAVTAAPGAAAAQGVTYYNDLMRAAPNSRIWWSQATNDSGPVAPVSAPIKSVSFENGCSMYISFDDSVSGIPFSSGINLYFNNVDTIERNGDMIEFQLKDPSFMRNWHWGLQAPANYGKSVFENLRMVFSLCGIDFE